MQPPGLPLHLAFRRSLGTENAGDWDATQRALRIYSVARAGRAIWLRVIFWGLLLLILFGGIARLIGAGPAWLDFRLFALFAIVGWAQIELQRLRKRRRPWLLPQLVPANLPESAWAFMRPFRDGEQVAYWDDKRGQTQRIPVGLMEPIEIVLLLSDDPDLRAIGLPWPRDMDEPDVVVVVETSAPAEPPVQLAVAYEPLALAAADADSSAGAADPTELQEDDAEEDVGRRGVIHRASSVYAQPLEAFRRAVAEQFDPDLAGDNQADFHAILAIHAAWEESPGTNSATRLIQKARRRFENRKRTDPTVHHIIWPDDRSLRRLIREDRREFAAIRRDLGLPPKPRPVRRSSSKRRKSGAGLQDEPRGSI